MGIFRGTFLDPVDDPGPPKSEFTPANMAADARAAQLEAARQKQLEIAKLTGAPAPPTPQNVAGAKYNINDGAFYGSNKGYETVANDQYWNTNDRTAFQMQAAQLAPAAVGTATQIGANERSANQNIGTIERGSFLGNADNMNASQINRQDEYGRQGQMSLIGQLQDQAAGRGPSLAGSQLRDAQDRNAKQSLSMAASMHGNGNSALAQRNVMNNLQQGNQQVAHDAAQARIQEQMNAYGALGSQLGNMRSQDIGVNTSQATFNQGATQNNMNANNTFAMKNSDISAANAGAYNARQQAQATIHQQNQQFNAGATNAYNLNQANMNQQMSQFNLGNQNTFALQQGQFDQATNANNLTSNVTNRSNNDAMSQYYLNTAIGQNRFDVNNAMALENAKASQSVGQAAINQRANEANAAREDRQVQMVLGAVGQAANLGVKVAGANTASSGTSTNRYDPGY